MNMQSIILLIVIAVLVLAVVINLYRNHKKGKRISCSGCCQSCGSSCPYAQGK